MWIILAVATALFSSAYGQECHPQFVAFEGSCYHFSATRLDWYDADEYCTSFRVNDYSSCHLVSVESYTEDTWLAQRIRGDSNFNFRDVWIGGSQVDKNVPGMLWISTYERFVYSNWSPNRPISTGKCVFMNEYYSLRWDHDDCDFRKSFVCEYKPTPEKNEVQPWEAAKLCKADYFPCGGDVRQCVPKPWVCDGQQDCLNGADEHHCPSKTCPDGYFSCGADSHGCVPRFWRCDGKNDCANGADEKHCEQQCPPGFVQNGNSCYYFVPSSLNWFDADQYCTYVIPGTSYFVHLASIESSEEHNFIAAHIRTNSELNGRNFWVSGNVLDKKRGWHWASTNEDMTFTAWASGQPDYSGLCVFLWYQQSYLWDDYFCDAINAGFTNLGFVCEYEI